MGTPVQLVITCIMSGAFYAVNRIPIAFLRLLITLPEYIRKCPPHAYIIGRFRMVDRNSLCRGSGSGMGGSYTEPSIVYMRHNAYPRLFKTVSAVNESPSNLTECLTEHLT